MWIETIVTPNRAGGSGVSLGCCSHAMLRGMVFYLFGY